MAEVYKLQFIDAIRQSNLQLVPNQTLGQEIEESIGSDVVSIQNTVVHETVQWLKGFSQEEQFALMGREMRFAAEAIKERKPVLFLSLDDTPAGDAHHVSALYEPDKDTFTIEVPDEPSDVVGADGQVYSRKGGRFPTVLHTIEMFVVAQKLAQRSLSLESDSSSLPYPKLEFVRKDATSQEQMPAKVSSYGDDAFIVAITPLTYQPDTSNVLIFNKNAQGRDINPKAIAQVHYEAMQNDFGIADVLLRHTMLLEGKVPGGNKVVEVGVMDEEETKQHRLYRTARIDASWVDPLQSPQLVSEVIDDKGRLRRRYSLNTESTDTKASVRHSKHKNGKVEEKNKSQALTVSEKASEEASYEGIIKKEKPRAVIVGAGVVGLTNAILAQEAGYTVTIYADLPPLQTTSVVAGATFAPYSVPLTEKVLNMTEHGWSKFADLSQETHKTGVRKIDYWEAESYPVDPKEKPYLQIMEDVQVFESPDVPGGYPQGVRYGTFIIDMPIYLPYLTERFKENGGLLVQKKFSNIHEFASLNADVIFNCTGLGAKELTDDENLTAIKGQLAIISARPDLEYAVKHDGFYAFPQPQTNRTVLGGTTVENFDTRIEPGTTQAIINGNKRVLSHLSEKDVKTSLVGLRPYRKEDVRVETQEIDGKLIVHNYGHGGAGVTLSWGSGRLAIKKS